LNAPVIGAEQAYQEPGSWTAAFGWRYQKSDRHFVGSDQQNYRQDENSEVINWVHQLELALTRTFTKRWNVTVGIPYLMAVRSQGLRDPFQPPNEFGNDPVAQRTETHANGLGDLSFIARRWIFDPTTHSKYNIYFGFGPKIPTGEYSVHDTRQVRDTTPNPPGTFQVENVVRTVDQSIQPGDGGFGVILDLQGFYRFWDSRMAGYFGGTYLINPAEENGVATYRGEGEEIMSVADQYLYRIGATYFPTGRTGVGLGLRWEGIPVHDLTGGNDGFRRPGYAFSAEPGYSYTMGQHTFTLQVPIAIHRNREKSVADLASEDQEGGDAAFADYVIIAGYIRRF
jgi:hypothetical protein